MPCRAHAVPCPCRAVPKQCPSRAEPIPCRVNSHMPCRAPAILRQCRVLRESPCGSRKYPNCQSYNLTYWYASDNNLRGTPHGSRKNPNAGRSPTCRLWATDANSHAALMPRCAVALRSRFQNGMVVPWHGRGMACVNQTRPHCVNQLERTQSKPLAARHGRGKSYAHHGNRMVCVN
jgi:hypothetical protein